MSEESIEAKEVFDGECFRTAGEIEMGGESSFELGRPTGGEVMLEGVGKRLATVRENAGEKDLEGLNITEVLDAGRVGIDNDQGGVDFRRRPEGAGRDFADDLDTVGGGGGESLDEDSERTVVAGAGLGGHAESDFVLHGEGQPREEQRSPVSPRLCRGFAR